MRLQDLVGLDVLVGLTYLDVERTVLRQEQFHGLIEKAGRSATSIRPPEGEELRWVPTEVTAFRPAPGGTYRLASTGQVVTDPTLLTSWMLTVVHDPEGNAKCEVEPNHAPLGRQSRVPREWTLDYRIKPDRIRQAITRFGDEYIGRSLLVGINHTGPERGLRSQEQLFGTIMVVDFDEGILVSCEPGGRTFVLPGDPCWVEKAPPGEYRLRSTGQVVTNPDYVTEVTIEQPE